MTPDCGVIVAARFRKALDLRTSIELVVAKRQMGDCAQLRASIKAPESENEEG